MMNITDKQKRLLGLIFILGVMVYSVSQYFKLTALMSVGGIVIIAMLVMAFLGTLRDGFQYM